MLDSMPHLTAWLLLLLSIQEQIGQLKAALEAAGVAASELRQGLKQAIAAKEEALQQLTVLKTSTAVEPVTVMPPAGKTAATAVFTALPPTGAFATQPGAAGKDPVRRNLAVEQFVPRGGASGGAKKGGSAFAALAIPPASWQGANHDSPAPPAKRTKSAAAPAPKPAAAKRGGPASQKAGGGSQAAAAPVKAPASGKKAAFVSALPDSEDDPFAFMDDA